MKACKIDYSLSLLLDSIVEADLKAKLSNDCNNNSGKQTQFSDWNHLIVGMSRQNFKPPFKKKLSNSEPI